MDNDARTESRASATARALLVGLVVALAAGGNYWLAAANVEGRLEWVLTAASDLGVGERVANRNVRWSLRRAEGPPAHEDRWLGRVTATRVFAGQPLTDANTRSLSALSARPGRTTLWVSLVENSGRMFLPGYRVTLAPDTTDGRSAQAGQDGRGLLVLAVDTLPSPKSLLVELGPTDADAWDDLRRGDWSPLVVGDDWSTSAGIRGRP